MKITVLRYVYGYARALLRARAAIAAGILLAVLGTACLHTMPTQWRVGAARVDITPDAAEIAAGNIWLGGFGSCLLDSRRATGVHDPIHARAMVISDGATTVAHVMADTPGISNRRIKAIRQRVFDATGHSEKQYHGRRNPYPFGSGHGRHLVRRERQLRIFFRSARCASGH